MFAKLGKNVKCFVFCLHKAEMLTKVFEKFGV
jgi:hypothetical protein